MKIFHIVVCAAVLLTMPIAGICQQESLENDRTRVLFYHSGFAADWTGSFDLEKLKGIGFHIMQPNGSYREYSIRGYHYSMVTDDFVESFDFAASLRYEMGRRIFGNMERAMFKAGIGIVPELNRTVVEPARSAFKTAKSTFSTSLELVFHGDFRVSERFRIDVAVPVRFLQFDHKMDRVDNPALPPEEQRNAKSDFHSLEQRLEFKVALGIRI